MMITTKQLLLVHGRSQGERNAKQIKDEWLSALDRGAKKTSGLTLPGNLDVRVPFYGKILDELTAARVTRARSTSRGGEGDQPDEFETEILLQLAKNSGITESEITEESGQPATERGYRNWPWVLAAGRLLSRRWPWLSAEVLQRMTSDVHTYLTDPDVTDEVNKIVKSELGPGPIVVVGHSLGSVVAYCVLASQDTPSSVPLFVTLGSPLGMPVIKNHLPLLDMPAGVNTWLNGTDVRDPVALFPRLDRDNFPADIENVSDIHNPDDNPHGISGYLSDRIIAQRIITAL